jgi:hypothetical protein
MPVIAITLTGQRPRPLRPAVHSTSFAALHHRGLARSPAPTPLLGQQDVGGSLTLILVALGAIGWPRARMKRAMHQEPGKAQTFSVAIPSRSFLIGT